MARRRKSGTRTKSGRLSRAYKGPARDTGHARATGQEVGRGERPPRPGALGHAGLRSCSPMACIDRDQLAAAERYRRMLCPEHSACRITDAACSPTARAAGRSTTTALERARQQLELALHQSVICEKVVDANPVTSSTTRSTSSGDELLVPNRAPDSDLHARALSCLERGAVSPQRNWACHGAGRTFSKRCVLPTWPPAPSRQNIKTTAAMPAFWRKAALPGS